MSERASTNHAWARLGVPVAGLALVLATFAPTVGFGFVSWDDPIHVTDNPLLLRAGEVSWLDHVLTPHLGYPTPVTMLSYHLEHVLFGSQSAAPYHVTNVLLHLACTALVYLLGRRLGLGRVGAAAAMLVFGLHPAAAEPVSWVTGRKDLLAGLFSLLAARDALHHPFQPKRLRTWLAPALFLLASFAKPVALFLVPLVPLWQLLRRSSVRQAIRAGVPFAVVAAAVFPLALMGQRATASVREDLGWLEVLRQAWYALGFNLSLVSLVRESSVTHLPQPWPPPFTPTVDLLPFAALAAIAAALWWLRPPRRALAWAALAWATLSYLPSSNLIPLTRYLAEVYLYLPMAGLGWLVGAVLDQAGEQLTARGRSRWVAGLVAASAALLATRAVDAATKWEDSAVLWGDAYRRYPHDYRLCRNTANGYFERGEPAAALAWFRHCVKRFGPEPFEKNIAVTLYHLGRHAEARDAFQRLVRRYPDDPVVHKYLRLLEQ